MVRPLVADLKDDGKVSRGWLGVGLQPIDAVLKKHLGDELLEGTVVGMVYPGTPAAEAGLEVGDVIVGLDGRAIDESGSLVKEIGMHPPGRMVVLNVRRGTRAMDVRVRLGERPEPGLHRHPGIRRRKGKIG